MATDYNVGDLVAEFLALCGVRTAFGIVSVHNIPMLDAIARRNAIRFVMARGELGGAHMADGYARASGGLGALVSSTGPGAANAVGGLIEARIAGTPLLHLTGNTITRFADRELGTVHDVPDQLGMLRSVCKTAYRVREARQALGVLTRAAVDALTPPTGPVSVEVPIDIQRTAIARPALLDAFALPLPAPLAPGEAAMAELAARVATAKRPMLWLGAGARHAGAAATRLLDLGFGMVTSLAGRGVVSDEHPMNLGGLNGNGLPMVQEFYKTCDLMIVVGSRLRGHETGDFSVALPANLIQVDADPLANGRTYPNTLFVAGDSRVVLEALADRVQGRMAVDPEFAPRFRALKEQARAAFRDTLGPYADFAAQLRAALPRDAIWVRDITLNNSTWGNKLFPLHGPRENIYPVGAGIGQGLQLGIGAALAAEGRKTVVMTGDGGFFLNMTELWTAVQERLDLTTIVMNDRGYGVIKHIQDSLYGGRRFYGDLMAPDLGQLAGVAGVPFFKVTEGAQFGATVARAIETGGPTLVEVDMTAIGPFPPYYPYDRKQA
jgi:acetolactate synthase-1/2/3 large subunit